VAPDDPAGTRVISATRRKPAGRYDAAAHLDFGERLVAAGATDRPCVIVLDNYSVHHRQIVKEAIPDLAARQITFVYLPPSSPELNPIAPVWKQVKYQDLPERSHATDVALQAAVEAALANRARLMKKTIHNLPRSA
jgi:transposase